MEETTARKPTAARRSHRKVRTGCKMCKSRKIKCDETKPQCLNCLRYGATCDLMQIGIISAPTSGSLFSFNSGPGGPDSSDGHASANGNVHGDTKSNSNSNSIGIPPLDMLDLELVHHWSCATCSTLCEDLAVQEFWRASAIRVALRADFVMRGILALSALHLAQLEPARETELLQRSVMHHDHSARTAMALMPVLDQEYNQDLADNLFVFSILTLYYVIASSRDPSLHLLLVGAGDNAPDWMALYAGTRHLGRVSRVGRDQHNIISPFINSAASRVQALKNPDKHPYLDVLRARLAATPLDGRLRAVYDTAVDELYKLFSVFYVHPDPTNRDVLDLFIWISSVAETFMPLLRTEPSQESLAIFSYFCMLPKRLPRKWWLNRWADSLKIRTYELLDTEHRAWVIEPSTWSST